MSLEGTDRFLSPYEEMKRSRDEINVCVFPDPKTPPEKYIYCPICHENMVPFGDDLICRKCGRKHEVKPVGAAEETGGLKQKNPPISKCNSFVVSSKDRKKPTESDTNTTQKDLQQIVTGGFITSWEETEI